MRVLNYFGRITAITLFAALAAAALAQQTETTARSLPADEVAAASAFRASVATVPGQPPAVTDEQKGDALVIRKQYQAAIQTYARIAKPSAAVWNKMGIAYEMLFDEKNAERAYKECLKLDPRSTGALNNLATIEDERGNYSAAERLYKQAIAVAPTARLYKNLGTNYMLQHKSQQSSDAYAQAVALDPHVFEVRNAPTAAAMASPKDCGEVSYLEARSCARAGLNKCALDRLRKSFSEGFATRSRVALDQDFASLRRMPEYERLLAEEP